MEDEEKKINAEVVAVHPDRVRISIDDLEDFQLAEEKLKVGSYLRIYDNDNAVLIAMIENFTIEVGVDINGNAVRKYFLEANPLGMLKGGKFERGGDTIAIPPKKLSRQQQMILLKSTQNRFKTNRSLHLQHYQQIPVYQFLLMVISSLISILQLLDQLALENHIRLPRFYKMQSKRKMENIQDLIMRIL